jgi:hypothetical protein
MTIRSWIVPAVSGSGFSFAPTGSTLEALDPTPPGLGGGLDQLIDPVTLSYVRTPFGEWAETADGRTMVMCMLEIELGASPFDPADGTRLKELLRIGDPVTPEEVQAETLRALGLLVRDGSISDLSCQIRDARGEVLRDQQGRAVAVTSWRDRVTGAAADISFSPG